MVEGVIELISILSISGERLMINSLLSNKSHLLFAGSLMINADVYSVEVVVVDC